MSAVLPCFSISNRASHGPCSGPVHVPSGWPPLLSLTTTPSAVARQVASGSALDGASFARPLRSAVARIKAIPPVECPVRDRAPVPPVCARLSILRVGAHAENLFATTASRIERGAAEASANAVLIKPNQDGTLLRARLALDATLAVGFEPVVSARSGDTEDAWLADLAVGWGVRQIKVGSTLRSERTAKWNRLLYLERSLGAPLASTPEWWRSDRRRS